MGILSKLRRKAGGEEKDFYVEISYGRGRTARLGYVKATEETITDKVLEMIQSRPDASQIKYYYITFPDGRKERFENPFYEAEEEEEKERRGKKEEVLDPLDVLKDTSEKLRKAYAMVFDESLNFQKSMFEAMSKAYGDLDEKIARAVESGVRAGVEAALRTVQQQQLAQQAVQQAQPQQQEDPFTWLLRIAAMSKMAEARRKRVKVVM